MKTKDFPSVELARRVVEKQAERYLEMMKPSTSETLYKWANELGEFGFILDSDEDIASILRVAAKELAESKKVPQSIVPAAVVSSVAGSGPNDVSVRWHGGIACCGTKLYKLIED